MPEKDSSAIPVVEAHEESEAAEPLAEKKPLHVRVVFYGLMVSTVVVTVLLLDLGMVSFAWWLSLNAAGLDYYTSMMVVTVARTVGIGLLIMTCWLARLGLPLYQRRGGRIVMKLLALTAMLAVALAISLALGILCLFLLFFWSPKQFAHWSKLRFRVYHGALLGIVFIWMLVEFIFSYGIMGFVLLLPILTPPLASVLRLANLGMLSLSGLVLVVPLFILLPKFWSMLWQARLRIEAFWVEFSRDWMGLVGFGIITVIVVLALLAPIIAPYPYNYGLGVIDPLLPPSPLHWLGTNQRGEDIFSQILYGGQISLLVGFTASAIAALVGTLIGLVAGYFRGFLDTVLMRITDVFLCLPTLPLMMIFLMMLGRGVQNIILVIAILGWVGTARMVRSEALSLRERPLTEAAHALGAGDGYIITKHILPNTLPLILANVVLGVVNAILSEAGITFLGFGDIYGQPSWGTVLFWASRGAALVNGYWWWLIPPGLLILLTALGFTFVSHSADKVVNPRLRKRRY